MKYSFTKGLFKAIISTVLFGIPVLLNVLPQEWQNLTIGGALALLYNFIKVKYLTTT